MLFNSMAYAIFLPLVFIIYWCIPSKYRWILLLGASYYFYMSWNPKYVVIIAFTTVVSYLCALALEKASSQPLRKIIVFIALMLCLGVLFIFKYYNFTLNTISHFVSFEPKYLDFLLPVGISFYTFQTLSYVIDVYRKEIKAEKHFGIYATFVSFFPQLVAGPIERSGNLLPQIKKKHVFDIEKARYGIWLIVWGVFKKVIVADNLAVFVDQVYGDVYSYSGFSLVLATLFFTFQIYCDFSGYSDIARGSANLFGIELMENFKSPYFSESVKDFWSRWHISLSTWFRDYLYIPMGGNRVGTIRNCFNVLVTFLVSGLWHGASWNFVIWGGLHGVAQVYENAFGIKKKSENIVYAIMRKIVVFCFVAYAWVFFRVENYRQGIYVTKALLSGITKPVEYFVNGTNSIGISASIAWKVALYLIPLFIFDYISLKSDLIEWIKTRKAITRHLVLILMIVLLLLFGYAGKSTFVYFQF